MRTRFDRLRFGVLVLLASLLPLAVQASMPTGGPVTAPASWLRAQVGPVPAGAQAAGRHRAFEQALSEAEASGARSLHAFLSTFLGAHARASGVAPVPTEGRSCQALLQALRQQLSETGMRLHPVPQASTPPMGLQSLARWGPAALSASDRLVAAGTPAHTQQHAFSKATGAFVRTVASRAPRPRWRMLFAGRRLGP